MEPHKRCQLAAVNSRRLISSKLCAQRALQSHHRFSRSFERIGISLTRFAGFEMKSKSKTKKETVAEREGFEPPVPFRLQRFSRPPVSTAHTPLRVSVSTVYQQSRIIAQSN